MTHQRNQDIYLPDENDGIKNTCLPGYDDDGISFSRPSQKAVETTNTDIREEESSSSELPLSTTTPPAPEHQRFLLGRTHTFAPIGVPFPLLEDSGSGVGPNGFCKRCAASIEMILRCGYWYSRDRPMSVNRSGHHHRSLREISNAADKGCLLCRILTVYFPRDTILTAQGDMGTFNISRFIAHELESWRISFIIDNVGLVLPREIWNQSIWLHPHAPMPEKIGTIETSTGSESSFHQIKAWIEDCDTNHPECTKQRGVSCIPTRLVAILPDHERLVLSSSLQQSSSDPPPKYATLSHCWGKKPIFTLTTSNISDMMRQIPTSQLTKTFQDAIDTTRRLGIPYIWIDSLCITQDSEADWLHDSILMADIYGGSYLTIAATSAIDSSAGCYRTRNPALIHPQPLTMSSSAQQPSYSETFSIHNFDIYKQSITNSPLASRAWALQERFLTSRTLHFAETQLLWECTHRLACESFPDEIPTPLATNHVWFRNRRENKNVWTDIVGQYSRCLLTNRRDKLVALEGIARWLRQEGNMKGGDEYLWGLWRKDLEHLLLWRVMETPARGEVLGFGDSFGYRAPSWSWASLDKAVGWPLWGGVELGNAVLVAEVMEVVAASWTCKGDGGEGKTDTLGDGRPVLRLRCSGLRQLRVSSILNQKSIPHKGIKLVEHYDEIEGSSSLLGSLTDMESELVRRRIGWKSTNANLVRRKCRALPITIRAPKRGGECLVAGIIVIDFRRHFMHPPMDLEAAASERPFLRVGTFQISDPTPNYSLLSPELTQPPEGETVVNLV